jgi:hypothetical protein
MRPTILFTTCLLVASLSAQQFESCRQVIGFGGATISLGSYHVSSTGGEAVIGTQRGTIYTVTQGFQQPELCITVAVEAINPLPNWKLQLFPNPTSGHLQLAWEGIGEVPDFQLHLVDVAGKILYQQNYLNPLPTLGIDLSGYPPGAYFLQVYLAESKESQAFSLLIQK